MSLRHRLAAAVTAAVMGTVVVPAGPADAVVLVNQPRFSAPLDGHFRVGVWYRTLDGGPRAYRVEVINPAGRIVLARSGKAPTHWKFWGIDVHRVGVWRTVYHVRNKKGDWVRAAFRTQVHR